MDPNQMPHFLSSEAERALMGEEEQARRLFHSNISPSPAPGSAARATYFHQQQPYAGFAHQMPLMSPMPSMPPMSSPYIVPSSPYSTTFGQQRPWQSLHADEVEGTSQLTFSEISRSSSPNNPADLENFGYLLPDGRSWRCAHPGCTSQAVFHRGCDLRKHFRRHTKFLFCRHEDCPQSTEGGFSSKKDRDRHEAKHKPGVPCDWEGCDRLFSRVDNMKDHVRRIHRKAHWRTVRLLFSNVRFDRFEIPRDAWFSFRNDIWRRRRDEPGFIIFLDAFLAKSTEVVVPFLQSLFSIWCFIFIHAVDGIWDWWPVRSCILSCHVLRRRRLK